MINRIAQIRIVLVEVTTTSHPYHIVRWDFTPRLTTMFTKGAILLKDRCIGELEKLRRRPSIQHTEQERGGTGGIVQRPVRFEFMEERGRRLQLQPVAKNLIAMPWGVGIDVASALERVYPRGTQLGEEGPVERRVVGRVHHTGALGLNHGTHHHLAREAVGRSRYALVWSDMVSGAGERVDLGFRLDEVPLAAAPAPFLELRRVPESDKAKLHQLGSGLGVKVRSLCVHDHYHVNVGHQVLVSAAPVRPLLGAALPRSLTLRAGLGYALRGSNLSRQAPGSLAYGSALTFFQFLSFFSLHR